MQNDSILVILETERKKYKVQAVVPGKLICMNKVILEDSQKVVSHYDSLGHIAILLPTKGQSQDIFLNIPAIQHICLAL